MAHKQRGQPSTLWTGFLLISMSCLCSADNITFSCPPDWQLIDTYCYNFVDVRLDFEDAKDVCDKYGAKLLIVRDEIEAKTLEPYVAAKLVSDDHYWIYNGREEPTSSSLCEGMWQANEPQQFSEQMAVASNKNSRWAVQSIWKKLPFVCRSPACATSEFRCFDGTCINNKWHCDGFFDCMDQSDEVNCPGSSCIKYSKDVFGDFNTTTGTCQWIVEAQPGVVLTVTFDRLILDDDVDVVSVYTGGPSIMTSQLVQEWRKSQQEPGHFAVFGRNHYVIISVQSETTEFKPEVLGTWEPDEQLTLAGEEILTVSETSQTIMSPYYDEVLKYQPKSFKKQWLLEAQEGQLITLQVLEGFEVDEELGEVFTVTNVGFHLKELNTNKAVYISNSHRMSVIIRAAQEGRRFKAQVTTGCNFSASMTVASFSLTDMPADLACSWIIENPLNTNMSLHLENTQFADDYDSFKIFSGVQGPAGVQLFEANITGPSTYNILDLPEKMSFLYSSDSILPANQITGKISADCPSIPNTNNMIIDSQLSRVAASTYSVNISCDLGFRFRQEEYGVQVINALCAEGGDWNWGSPSFTRFPECQEIYCGLPPSIPNGKISDISTVRFGGIVTYACTGGFNISTPNTAQCQADGTWTNLPKCAAVQCPEPALPAHLNYTITPGLSQELLPGSVLKYLCDPGYDLMGAHQVACFANASWSHPTPTCQKLTCSLPEVDFGNFESPTAILPEFGELVTLTCESGFVINGTMDSAQNFTCTADRQLDWTNQTCVDLDECKDPTACGQDEDCINKHGSHECVCAQGFTGSPGNCTAIPECERRPCDQHCSDQPHYQCTCSPGYTLFVANGTNGFFIPEGESGLKPGDVYLINNTCVEMVCESPPSPLDHGSFLTNKTRFLYNETVEIVCDYGYLLEGQSVATCGEHGNWSYAGGHPKCRKLSCDVPPIGRLEVLRVPDSSTIDPGKPLIIVCGSITAEGNPQNISKTMFCAAGPDDLMNFTLQGDSPVCPDVDCGEPWALAGANQGEVVNTTYGSSFEFSCDASQGFQKNGSSSLGNDTVVCEASGRWGYGTLLCEGLRCRDPGTMAGTYQTEDSSYEVGHSVHYKCLQPGYTAVPNDTLVCAYHNGTAIWTGDPPTCIDKEPPQLNCANPQPFDLYDVLVYDKPTSADNSNFTCVRLRDGPASGTSVVTENGTVQYTASDRDQTVSCTIDIILKDQTPPQLECPEFLEEDLQGNATGEFIISEAVLKSYSRDGALSLEPEGLIKIVAGEVHAIRARLDKPNGLLKECAFLLIVKSSVCRNDTFSPPDHGHVQCSGTADNMHCNSTCDDGYLFQDKSNHMTVTCLNGAWSAKAPLQPCVKLSEPTFDFEVSITYNFTGTKLPPGSFDQNACYGIFSQLLASHVDAITECGLNSFRVAGIQRLSEPQIYSDRIGFTLTVVSNASMSVLGQCAAKLYEKRTTLFGPIEGETGPSAPKCLFPWIVLNATSDVIRPLTYSCTNSTLITSSGEYHCLPCGPGTFFDTSSEICMSCPDGSYQDEANQYQCKVCPASFSSDLPRSSQDHCQEPCPEGFEGSIDSDNCTACPEDHYFLGTCQPCQPDSSTVGVSGAKNSSYCMNACVPGQYSLSGYEPCNECPLNFFSNDRAATKCTECPSHAYTDRPGSSLSSECKTEDLCTADFCDSAGTMDATVCQIVNHRAVCTCKEGFYGDKCDQSCDVCQPNPCYNDGTCTSSGTSFNCSCKAKCTFDPEPNLKFDSNVNEAITFEKAESSDACRQLCLTNLKCVAYMYGDGFCYQYDKLLVEKGDYPYPSDSYRKNCSEKMFSGERCEIDEEDNCEQTTCADIDFCVDLVNASMCRCPLDGNYNDRCENPSDPCENVTCSTNGLCEAYDSVRFVCICDAGYTGRLCETNIDDCQENPGACLFGGSCIDGVNSYSCDCQSGYGGEHCQQLPDFCGHQPCHPGNCFNNYHYFAANCTCAEHFQLVSDECREINACESSPCQHEGSCIEVTGGFHCQCAPGFEGSVCQHNIDDCSNTPCLNGATCVDEVDNFNCACSSGFTGRLCEVNVNDCDNACVDDNTDSFTDLVDDCQCLCRNGFTGKNCSEDVDECVTLQPCLHGGACNNSYGGYHCRCTQGWTGTNCQEEQDYCSENPCQNMGFCYNLTDTFYCQCENGTSGDSCELKEELCDNFGSVICTTQGKCELEGGTAKCSCKGDYAGLSCELERNLCADDPCNGGVCMLNNLTYTCDCSHVENYRGPTCREKVLVCQDCPAGTPCVQYQHGAGILQPACLCPGNAILASGECKEVDTNHDLAFLKPFTDGDTWITSERAFLLGNNSDLTLTLWMAAAHTLDVNTFVLALSSAKSKNPFLAVFKDRVRFSSNDSVPLRDRYSSYNLDDKFIWHFIAISWAADGKLKILLDAIELEVPQLEGAASATDELVFVHLGQAFYGYISQVSIWSTVLPNSDIFKMFDDKLLVPQFDDLLLGWTQFSYNIYVHRTSISMAGAYQSACNASALIQADGDDCEHEDKRPPELKGDCKPVYPVILDYSKHQVSTGQLEYTFTEPWQFITEKQTVTHGAYDVAVAAKDEMGNIGVCRTRMYVTPNSECDSEPFTPVSVQCTDTPTGRKVQCPEGQRPSVPTPNYIRCGKLNTYNLDSIYDKPDRIVCGNSISRTVNLHLILPYTLAITCRDQTVTSMTEAITQNLKKLNMSWPGVCADDQCSNIQASGSCEGGPPVDISVTIAGLREFLNSSSSQQSLTPWELMTKTIKAGTVFDISFVAGSKFDGENARIDAPFECAEHYALIGLYCVECGPGSYYSSSDKSCRLCELNQFSSGTRQTTCTPCPEGQVTMQRGSSTVDDCKKECALGHLLNVTTNDCEPCPKNFYQNSTGKDYCFPCRPSAGTEGTGSESETDCKDYCEPGTELKDGHCVPCQRGFYREGEHEDPCTPCPNATFTTREEGSEKESDCNIPRCPPGQFVNESSGSPQCEECDYGQYQPQEAQFDCLPCNESFTTENQGAQNASQCLFFCGAGHEEDPGGEGCQPCQLGYFHSDALDKRFENCTACPDGFTTSQQGATDISDCKIPICGAGTYLNETECLPCSMGSYQDEILQTQCKPCPANMQTEVEGAISEDNCTFVCPAGEEVDNSGASCIACPRGSYKDGTMMFDSCKNCSADKTTDVTGAVSESMCNVAKCSSGFKVSADNATCVKCPVDMYQDLEPPLSTTECKDCPSGTGTVQDAAPSNTACKVFCGAGYGVTNNSCAPCARGTWNNGNATLRFLECQSCPDGFTTDVEQMATDIANCSLRDCQPGSYYNGTVGDCLQCPVGFYQNESLQAKCLECPDNTSTREEGSMSKDNCTIFCPAGEEGSGEACVPCGSDEYKSEPSFGSCFQCEGDVTSTPENRTACTEAFCDTGREPDSMAGSCSDCRKGFYKSVRGNTQCRPCPGNFTTQAQAATSPSHCSVLDCEPGFYSEDNQTCAACAVGTYKNESGIQNCTQCPDGVTTEAAASTKLADCYLKVCSKGQYRNSSTNQCQECKLGTYQDEEGQLACEPCRENHTTLNPGAADETDCRIVCEAGNYRNDSDNTCLPCKAGSYQPEQGQTECSPCTGNFTTDMEGSTSKDQCYVSCPVGYYRINSTQCLPCAVGQYQNETGQTSCTSCGIISGHQSTTQQGASTSETQCKPLCSEGLYLDNSNRSCLLCPIGTYKNTTDLQTQCTSCPKGNTTSAAGATTIQNCTLACKKGEYRPVGSEVCKPCALGSYQNREEDLSVTACTPCPDDKTTLITGATEESYCIVDCPEGSEYTFGTGNCTLCPIGQFRPSTSQTCQLCRPGTTTLLEGQSECIKAPSESSPEPTVKINVTVSVVFEVQFAGNMDAIMKIIKDIIVQLITKQSEFYHGLCPSNCSQNVLINFGSLSSTPRIKRQSAARKLEVLVTVTNLDNVLPQNETLDFRQALAVVEEAFYDLRDVQDTLDGYGLQIVSLTASLVCDSGYENIGGKCTRCEAGQYTLDGRCTNCPKGSYSTKEVSDRCERCPADQTTNGPKTGSKDGCDGHCFFEESYCQNDGKCAGEAGSHRCVCTSKYMGMDCSAQVQQDGDSTLGVVVGASVGIAAFLLLILLIFGILAYTRRQKTAAKKNQSISSDSDHMGHKLAMYNPAFVPVADPTMYTSEMMDLYDTEPSMYDNRGHGHRSRDTSFEIRDHRSQRSHSRSRHDRYSSLD